MPTETEGKVQRAKEALGEVDRRGPQNPDREQAPG